MSQEQLSQFRSLGLVYLRIIVAGSVSTSLKSGVFTKATAGNFHSYHKAAEAANDVCSYSISSEETRERSSRSEGESVHE